MPSKIPSQNVFVIVSRPPSNARPFAVENLLSRLTRKFQFEFDLSSYVLHTTIVVNYVNWRASLFHCHGGSPTGAVLIEMVDVNHSTRRVTGILLGGGRENR